MGYIDYTPSLGGVTVQQAVDALSQSFNISGLIEGDEPKNRFHPTPLKSCPNCNAGYTRNSIEKKECEYCNTVVR